MLDYFIKVLLFQVLFLAVYDIILKKETFFQWNRAYLICTSVLAYTLPFVKIQQVAKAVPQEYVVMLPEVVLSPQTVLKDSIDWSVLLFTSLKWIFLIGVFVTFLLFIIKLVRLITTINQNEKEKTKDYNLIHLNGTLAFSFFNYIFLGKHISKDNKAQIIAHELVHVKQKHSLDLLFFELQKIVCWFNPFSYIFQNRISEIHEFIADSKLIKQEDKKSYFQNILAEAFGTHKISFINHFFKHSLIKKRIVMLNKAKSKRLLKFKYLLLLPLLVGMLIYSSCERQEEQQFSVNKNEKRLVKLYYKGLNDNEVKEITSKKKGYFDIYHLAAEPQNAIEITYDDLTGEEKYYYDDLKTSFNKNFGDGSHEYRIYQHVDGKKSLKEVINWKKMKSSKDVVDYSNTEEVPFAAVDEAPIFPDCDASNAKDCFTKNIMKHVRDNFDTNVAQSLGLSKGKKRIIALFKVTKNGDIEIKGVRAPHKDLDNEARRILNMLPKMTPGKHNGKAVSVDYQLPIGFVVN